jgi:hypothetical protein
LVEEPMNAGDAEGEVDSSEDMVFIYAGSVLEK